MSKINSITINNVSVNFKDGLIIKDILNQNLDTGVLVIPDSVQLDIQPMDEVVITYETIKVKRMLVGTINQKISSFGATKKYLYEIGLVSLTIKLQRIVLPSRSITNSVDGTNDYTIRQVFDRYLDMYAPEISLSSSLITKLGTLKCPETQWQRPTLFEVFNDLLKPLGSVVTLTSLTTLSYLDLDEEGNEISEDDIMIMEVGHDITTYTSAIEVEASNVYNSSSLTKTPEKYTTKTLQQGLLTTDNDSIVLQKPIFEIKKLTCTFPYQDGNNDWQKYTLDITDRVINKKVYDTFYPNINQGRVADTSSKKYLRNYIYYIEGQNVIDGLKFREEDWLGSITVDRTAIDNVIYWTLTSLGETQVRNAVDANFDSYLLREVSFNVEYLTVDKILFRARKSIPQRNESILINAQSNPIVNAKLLGEQQQEFVDRVGNKEMTIIGRYSSYDDVPSLKDYYYFNNEKFVLIQREIVFNANYYNFKGMLSANYSMDNMFAGINSERRYSSIAEPSEALVSNHLTEVFIEINNSDDNNTGWGAETENYIAQNLGKKDKYVQGAIFSTSEVNTQFINDELLLETTAHPIGKSVIIAMNMSDNYNSHLRIGSEFTVLGSQQMMEYVPYVDENGRFTELKIELYRYDSNYANRGFNFKPYYINPLINQATYQTNDDYFINAAYNSSRLPVIPRTATYYDVDPVTAQLQLQTYNVINDTARIFTTGDSSDFWVKRYKDSREITYETIQFHFNGVVSNANGSTKNIFVTNLFAEYTPFIYDGSSINYSFRIAYSTSLEYNVNDKRYKGSLMPNTVARISVSGNQISIIDISPRTTWSTIKNGIKSYAICDASGNILIAVNKSGTYEPLYVNRK